MGSSIDSRASVADWRRSYIDLGSELGLFVGLCVDLRTVGPKAYHSSFDDDQLMKL